MTTSAQVAERQSSLPTNVLLRTTLNQTIRLHHHEFYTIALAMFDMMTSAVSSLISTAPLRTIARQYFVFKAIPVLLLLLLLLLVSCLLSRNGLWSTRSPRLYWRIFEHFSLHPSFPGLFEVQQWQVSYNRRRTQLHSSQCWVSFPSLYHSFVSMNLIFHIVLLWPRWDTPLSMCCILEVYAQRYLFWWTYVRICFGYN